MPVVLLHQGPTLTKERYEESVVRLRAADTPNAETSVALLTMSTRSELDTFG
jgi:hypothetical protein